MSDSDIAAILNKALNKAMEDIIADPTKKKYVVLCNTTHGIDVIPMNEVVNIKAVTVAKDFLQTFITTYQPQNVESIVLKSIWLYLNPLDEILLYNNIHHCFDRTKHKEYSDHMKNSLSRPIIKLMREKSKGKITALSFAEKVNNIILKHNPESVEGTYIKRLIEILSSSTSPHKDIKDLIKEETLKAQSNQWLKDKMRKPLIAILHQYNQWVENRKISKGALKAARNYYKK